MPAFLSFKISNSNLLSLVLALFPASFIAGNLIINLNIIILILLSAILFKKEIFSIKITILDKLFLLFFLLIILTGFYNDYKFIVNELDWKSRYSTIEKSFSYLRYFLLYFIIRFLVEKDKLNLDFFFISCLVCTLFVSFDIFYQLIVGKDILVAIGPSISGDNYLLDKKTFYKFISANNESLRIEKEYLNNENDHESIPLDIKKHAYLQLLMENLDRNNIDISSRCTYSLPNEFHSWRRSKNDKRQWSVICS